MDLFYQVLIFLGAIFQAVMMVKYVPKKSDLKKLIILFLFLLIGAIVMSFEGGFDFFVLYMAMLFSFSIVFYFRDKITSFLDEKIFILFNILFIYFLFLYGNIFYYILVFFIAVLVLMVYFAIKNIDSNPSMSKLIFSFGGFFIFLVISVLVFLPIIFDFSFQNILLFLIVILIPLFFIIATIPNKIHSIAFQGVSYLWYTIVVLIVESFVFLEIYFAISMGEELPLYLYFFIGASIIYFLSLIVNIFMSLPIKSKRETTQEALQKVLNSMILFSNKFSNYQMTFIETIIILVFSIFIFGFHYFTNFVPFETLVIVLLPMIVFVFRVKNNDKVIAS